MPEKRFSLQPGRGGSNLTRIWGAEFLRSNLQEHGALNAAEHFLIVDDTTEEIEVQIAMCNDYPHLSSVNNAHVISKKVDGVGEAWSYRYSNPLKSVGYNDFKDPGNIMKDAEGIGWVVDTELKSFDPPKQSPDPLLNHYLIRRYKALSTEDCSTSCQIFKIKVADLNLK